MAKHSGIFIKLILYAVKIEKSQDKLGLTHMLTSHLWLHDRSPTTMHVWCILLF